MPDTAIIYGLFDPRDGQLRYVGKTVSPKARKLAHKSDPSNSSKLAWVKELASSGLEPKFIILSEVPFEEWQQHEREAIARYRRLGCSLLNVQDGGGANPRFSRLTKRVLFRTSSDLLEKLEIAADLEFEGNVSLLAREAFREKLEKLAKRHPELRDAVAA
jgi:hypothetical protein